jgi:hypothetical protein
MVDRLKKAVRQKRKKYGTVEEAKQSKKKKQKLLNKEDGLKSFHPNAHWRELRPYEDAVEEPTNPSFRIHRAPTVPADEADSVPVKHDFGDTFEIPKFAGKNIDFVKTRRGDFKTDHLGNKKPTQSERLEGRVNPRWLQKHKLSAKSKPWEFAEAFIPMEHKDKALKHMFSFDQLQQWTNLKASICGAGSTIYKKGYKPFTAKEIRQHFGLYVLNGVSPSPRVEYKFRPQRVDRVAGNDFCFASFGANAKERHKHFKAFLSCCDPRRETPSRDVQPNWKVRPIISWINYSCPKAWELGRALAVDEMTMRFKGKHKDKRRITYKAEGDGFQADALCDNGYTYQVYMRNDPAPSKYLKQGLSPLHSRTMALFDSLKDDYHQVGMDNLYNSAAFCRAAYNHPRKVLCHGVTRKAGRGIPACVLQEPVINPRLQKAVRGTVKAAVLEGDPGCPNLIASSVYDTKPVHYLSMVSDSIEWVVKEKNVYNIDTDEVEALKFLRLNYINKYNQEMGGVDIADQLRGCYRIDRFVRNRKWWWSMLFWSIGVLLTNAFKVYLTVCKEEGVTPMYKQQYEFRKKIAEYWINPDLVEKETKSKSIPSLLSPASDATMSPITNPFAGSPWSSPTSGASTCRMTDATLGERGSMSCRLDQSIDHVPERALTRTRCQLHHWAASIRKESEMLYCSSCCVHLCITCYGLFHRQAHLVKMKKKLGIHLKAEHNKKKRPY